jgi:predicted PolB exonuclease-like 3'-5' exonuclease
VNDSSVTYLAFDIETVADGQLVARIRYPEEKLDPLAAVHRYRAELLEKYENDFIPYTFQVPIAVAVGKIAADYRLLDVAVLDEPNFRPHVLTEHFWRGWDRYRRPTLVSFNGRTFDLPLMELAAFRYGVSVPGWFNVGAKSFEQYRNRFNLDAHIDLQEILTNFGSTRFTGGLNLAANLLGKPGKMDVQGHMVQDLFDRGQLKEINDYCRCDLLDTYFVFLRTRVLFGEISLDQEQGLIGQTRSWLMKRASTETAFAAYLERWGDWPNPWKSSPASG